MGKYDGDPLFNGCQYPKRTLWSVYGIITMMKLQRKQKTPAGQLFCHGIMNRLNTQN
jgi:hypothetical protein